MDVELNQYALDESNIVRGHQPCQTTGAKWLCLKSIYQKFHRPNFYDIGGTYIADVADFWFMYKTEQVGNIFLLHLFVSNRHEAAYGVRVSYGSNLKIDERHAVAFLTPTLKEYGFRKTKELIPNYVTTYSFSDLDVDFLKDKVLYIAVSIPKETYIGVKQQLVDEVKMNHDFKALFKDPLGSDFVIESIDGHKFNVHKIILASQSEVFKAMLKGDTAENQNNFVKLGDASTDDLRCILEFIYTGTVKDLENCNFFNLLKLADKYNLNGLRELSEHALAQMMTMEDAIDILVVADMFNADILKITAMKFIKKHPSVIHSSRFKEMNPALARELCKYLVPSE